MRKADIIFALILATLGGLVLRESLKLNIEWGVNGPEAGFFPFWLAVGLMVSSLVVVGQAIRGGRSSSEAPFIGKGGLKSVLLVALPAAGMVALTEIVGLYVAAALYLALYMRWIGRHRWMTVLAISLLFPLAVYFIFDKWFLIPLPKGRLESLFSF